MSSKSGLYYIKSVGHAAFWGRLDLEALISFNNLLLPVLREIQGSTPPGAVRSDGARKAGSE